MQTDFSHLLTRCNQTYDKNTILEACAHFLANQDSAITWEQIRDAANSNLPIPTDQLSPATLALYVQAVAWTLVDSEPEEADQRPFRRRRIQDDEENDSFVVSDNEVEYDDSSSSSSEVLSIKIKPF